MSAFERLDEAISGFRDAVAMLDTPGRYAGRYHMRPETQRLLRAAREQAGVLDVHDDANDPAYHVDHKH